MSERVEALDHISAELRVMARRFKGLITERAMEVHPQLQPSAYFILAWLVDNGPARGSALSCEFHIDKGAISRQIQHLVDLDLVERSADPGDGRAQLVSATAGARQRMRDAEVARRQRWHEQLDGWSIEELRTFAAQLDRFNVDVG